jgi:hypothetical protein
MRILPYVAAAGAILFLGLASLWMPMGRDQGIHAAIAMAMDEGLLPYRDVYNIKPPATTLMHWLSQELFGRNMWAIRALDLAVTLAAGLALAAAVAGMTASAWTGAAAAIVFAGYYYELQLWHQAQTDGWAAAFLALSAATMVRGWRVPGWGWFLLAGMLAAVAFSFKYTIGCFGALIFAPLLARDALARFRIVDLAAFVTGGLATLALVAGIMQAAGVLEPFLEIQLYITGYIGDGFAPVSLSDALDILRPSGAMFGAFTLALAVLAVDLLRRGPRLATVVLMLWLWAGWISGFVQGKGFAYHYLPLLAPAAGLVAVALAVLGGRAGPRLTHPALAGALVLALLGLTLTAPRRTLALVAPESRARLAQHEMSYETRDYSMPAILAADAALDEVRRPGESLFLWGYDPVLYLLQNEPPRYRYPYSWPFVVSFHDGRYSGDLMARLTADPPDVLVVENGDATPHVTGTDADSRAAVALVPGLETFISTNYRIVRSLQRFDILRRNGT